jgi:hypothetical protein
MRTVLQDLEGLGLLRNELRIFGATTCHMTRRIDALEEDGCLAYETNQAPPKPGHSI